VNKTAASAFCFTLINVQHCSSQLREYKQKLHIAYLTSWHNS